MRLKLYHYKITLIPFILIFSILFSSVVILKLVGDILTHAGYGDFIIDAINMSILGFVYKYYVIKEIKTCKNISNFFEDIFRQLNFSYDIKIKKHWIPCYYTIEFEVDETLEKLIGNKDIKIEIFSTSLLRLKEDILNYLTNLPKVCDDIDTIDYEKTVIVKLKNADVFDIWKTDPAQFNMQFCILNKDTLLYKNPYKMSLAVDTITIDVKVYKTVYDILGYFSNLEILGGEQNVKGN